MPAGAVRIPNRVKIGGDPLDLRGDGGYVVAPPSIHANGQRYTWSDEAIDFFKHDRPLPELPLDALVKAEAACPRWQPPPYRSPLIPLPYRLERCRRYVAKMPAAISGSGGHNATFRVACAAAGVFHLDVAEVYEILVEYNERCVPPWSPRELRHKAEEAVRVTNCAPSFLERAD